MIYEYALDPKVVATWGNRHDFRYFIEKFGLGQPRLVSRYPKRWKRLVWDAYEGTDDLEKSRLTELLFRLSEKQITRENSHYDGKDWLDNALREHDKNPFQAIISSADSIKKPFVLNAETISGTQSLWAVPTTMVIPRVAEKMALFLMPLLSSASEILFIDPHFGPENSRHRRTFKRFLTAINDNRKSKLMRVEIHTQVKSPEDFFRAECSTRLTRLIPKGMRISFIRWTKKDDGQALHNRYILTDIGGVAFQHGLDEGRTGETDDVAILDRDAYVVRWGQYAGKNPAFDLRDRPFEIVGGNEKVQVLSKEDILKRWGGT